MIATSPADAVSSNSVFPSTVISDAFEAVTNGMHNPEALERLSTLNEDSAEWVNVIDAIRAFYAQNFDLMEKLLLLIPDDSKAGRLKRVLFHMAGCADTDEKLSFHEEKLAKRVTEDSRFLSSAIEQLRESIEYGEELFSETVSLLIKEVKKNPGAAERLALWSLRLCSERDFDDEALSDNLIMLFGQAEGLRLIGLSLIESEPDSALICFTRSLINKLTDRVISANETAAYLEIIAALISACPADAPVLLDISEMLTMLESEMAVFFSLEQPRRDISPGERVAVMINLLNGLKSGSNIPPAQPKTPHTAVQLELF